MTTIATRADIEINRLHKHITELNREIRDLKQRHAELLGLKDANIDYRYCALMAVVNYYPDINMNLIRSKSRLRELVEPRHIFMYLLNKYSPLSLCAIGRYCDRDHSSVCHAKDCVMDLQDTNAEYRKRLALIEAKFKEIASTENWGKKI